MQSAEESRKPGGQVGEGDQEVEGSGVWGGESRKEESREEEYVDGQDEADVYRAQKNLAKEERGEQKKEGEENEEKALPWSIGVGC